MFIFNNDAVVENVGFLTYTTTKSTVYFCSSYMYSVSNVERNAKKLFIERECSTLEEIYTVPVN